MQPTVMGPVPEETARVARAAFPKGNLYMQIRDILGAVYENASFTELFAARGRPAEAPWRLALVTQFAEGLSDRQAAEAVRGRIDWKYALGLDLTDPGFDFSVPSEFRTRLVDGSLEHLLLESLLKACQACGYLKARGRQRTDSTHILGVHGQVLLRQVTSLTQFCQRSHRSTPFRKPVWPVQALPDQVAARLGHGLRVYPMYDKSS